MSRARILIEPAWDDRVNAWRLSVIEGDTDPMWLPGVARAGTGHRLWPVVAAAAAATRKRGRATSDHEGMRWDPSMTDRDDMAAIAKVAQAAAAKVQP